MSLRTEVIHVIAKIYCYFYCSVVTLQLRKEYLNAVTCNIPVLLKIKNWTGIFYMSTDTVVAKSEKFLAHPV